MCWINDYVNSVIVLYCIVCYCSNCKGCLARVQSSVLFILSPYFYVTHQYLWVCYLSLLAPGTWCVSPTSVSVCWYQQLNQSPFSISFTLPLQQIWELTAVSMLTAAAACGWSKVERRRRRNGRGERAVRGEPYRSHTQHWDAVAALRTRDTWEDLSLAKRMDCERGIQMRRKSDCHHPGGDDMWSGKDNKAF